MTLETLGKAEKIVKEIKKKKGLIGLIRRDRILVVAEEDAQHNCERINDAMKELLVTQAEKEVLALEKELAEL